MSEQVIPRREVNRVIPPREKTSPPFSNNTEGRKRPKTLVEQAAEGMLRLIDLFKGKPNLKTPRRENVMPPAEPALEPESYEIVLQKIASYPSPTKDQIATVAVPIAKPTEKANQPSVETKVAQQVEKPSEVPASSSEPVAKENEDLARIAREKELEIRNIRNIVAQYADRGLVFFHGIQPDTTKSDIAANAVTRSGASWQRQLDNLLQNEPDISASTMQRGDTPMNMWSRMGVILSDGQVEDARPIDSGTVAYGPEERHFRGTLGSMIGMDIKERIDYSIKNRDSREYNEFVIDDPKVAGFYICTDPLPSTLVRDDERPAVEIYEKTSQLGLPVFVIKSGELYETDYDPDANEHEGEFRPKPNPITSTEIMNMRPA